MLINEARLNRNKSSWWIMKMWCGIFCAFKNFDMCGTNLRRFLRQLRIGTITASFFLSKTFELLIVIRFPTLKLFACLSKTAAGCFEIQNNGTTRKNTTKTTKKDKNFLKTLFIFGSFKATEVKTFEFERIFNLFAQLWDKLRQFRRHFSVSTSGCWLWDSD